MVQIEGFRRLAEKARDVPEPALIFQIVGLQGSYLEQARLMCASKSSPGLGVRLLSGGGSATACGLDIEHGRSRACSTSSSGYPLRHSSGGVLVRPPETELPTSIAAATATEEDASSSIAGQGLHIAFNFVSELLK